MKIEKLLTPIEVTQRAILRCEQKMAAVEDELSKFYYRQCIIGHKAELVRLRAQEEGAG